MRWEYKTVIEADNYHLRKELNRLGDKGWEAYSVVVLDYTHGNVDPSIFQKKLLPTEVYIAYLKRPKK